MNLGREFLAEVEDVLDRLYTAAAGAWPQGSQMHQQALEDARTLKEVVKRMVARWEREGARWWR